MRTLYFIISNLGVDALRGRYHTSSLSINVYVAVKDTAGVRFALHGYEVAAGMDLRGTSMVPIALVLPFSISPLRTSKGHGYAGLQDTSVPANYLQLPPSPSSFFFPYYSVSFQKQSHTLSRCA